MQKWLIPTVALILTACSKPVPLPKLTPVEVIPAQKVACGKVRYQKEGERVTIDAKGAKCLKQMLLTCAKDRQKLLIANRANVAQMRRYNERVLHDTRL